MPAAAIVGAAVVGAVASNSAASKQAKAARQAADLSSQAQDRATEAQDRQYAQTRQDQLALLAQQRQDQTPYREAGYGALSQLAGGSAAGGQFNRDFTMADYMADPGMQFRQQQGEQAINRAATAAGGRYSGATLKALQRFNSDLSSQEFGNAYNRFQNNVSSRYNRLASLAGIGQTANNQTQQAGSSAYGTIASAGQNAANNIGGFAMNGANAVGSNMQNAAAARASGYVGGANLLGSAVGQLANNYQQQQYLNQLNGGYYTPSQSGYADLNANATNQSGNFAEYGTGYSP